jgi:predicted porin
MQVLPRWGLSAGVIYTQSKASYESIKLELPEETIEHADYDWSQVHTFSDLEYKYTEANAKVDFEFSRAADVYLGVQYFDLMDDQPYVYGDVTGSVLFTQAGVRVKF